MMNESVKEPFKVTVYITSHNYGRFLSEAVESVLRQTLRDWELIIMDDGSRDQSVAIAREYQGRHSDRIRLVSTEEPRGLRACANEAIEMARGRYIMRLDADDYLDENALLVLSHHLDSHPDVALVFPNWTYVAEDGAFLGVERRRILGREVQVLDLPAHGACTMVRRRIIRSVGGYDLSHDSQDGHELWLKIINRHAVANVETPLFYYRQHGSSMSRNEERLLAARRKIKRSEVARTEGSVAPNVVAIVPARNLAKGMEGIALAPLSGKPLIDHTIDVALEESCFNTVFVSTDDPRVVEHCSGRGNVIAEVREIALSDPRAKLAGVVAAAVRSLEEGHGISPDIVVLLSIHSPLRRAVHIREAIDTLLLYGVDNVIATHEDYDLHFRHGEHGMEPLNPGAVNQLRFEREALYVDNGAVHALWREFIDGEDLFRGRVGHIVMTKFESFQIKKPEDIPYLEAIHHLQQRIEKTKE